MRQDLHLETIFVQQQIHFHIAGKVKLFRIPAAAPLKMTQSTVPHLMSDDALTFFLIHFQVKLCIHKDPCSIRGGGGHAAVDHGNQIKMHGKVSHKRMPFQHPAAVKHHQLTDFFFQRLFSGIGLAVFFHKSNRLCGLYFC